MIVGLLVDMRNICSLSSYTLIGAHLFNGEKVLEIRNPWGKGTEWNGKWSDNDSAWTPELREEFGHIENEDGRFFMPYIEFFKHFEQLAICYYYDNYIYSNVGGEKNSNKYTIFKFEITQENDFYVCLSQADEHGFYADDSKN